MARVQTLRQKDRGAVRVHHRTRYRMPLAMPTQNPSLRDLEQHDAFIARHIGPNDAEVARMLRTLGFDRAGVHEWETGRTLSVRDGHWVIVFGENGAVGYVAQLGLLAYPILAAFRARRRLRSRADLARIEGLSLIVAIHLLDLVPNGLFSYLPLFFAGSLLGAVDGLGRRAEPGRERVAALERVGGDEPEAPLELARRDGVHRRRG